MNVDTLLSHLTKVRPTGGNEWVACCPSHPDKSPSLAIKDVGDGRILVHCFAGCSADEVMGSLGLTLSDLMPEKALTSQDLRRVPFNARTVLEALSWQAMVVSVCAADMANGKRLSADDKDALFTIAGGIEEAVAYAAR
jgi:CHC2 zinc finger